jgi:hypothetical protein
VKNAVAYSCRLTITTKRFCKIGLRDLEKVEKDPFLSLPVKCGGETAADKIRISLKIISDILLNNKKQNKKYFFYIS